MPGRDGDMIELLARGDGKALAAALEAGADANARDPLGESLLARAAAAGDLEAVRLLVGHGAQVNRTGDTGNSALMAAAAGGHLDVVVALLEVGADPEHRNKWGLAAADWAVWPANSAEILTELRAGPR